ncbi:nucleotidyltransferase domain-containing protein [Streptomyces sp. VRA16 Mangrove soil]|uniref:nucleotidyltransferase domain-containing protein n=1 Tax=Streptomyces sp. VRA16 Mangrove soil TaxID=2817434 RepID=UPI001A9CDF0A|nr:nucleotidyltransferase domain-containing protein [Streptomyces sp. VRA16 Mangrove soil]MBO1333768.1 nucleotidyltransferase domain-containing protein [Streptomyces sp. VRA16 Mangrove soil]
MADPNRGLDPQGYIAREGSLGRIEEPFRPVVAAARDRLLDVFGARLSGAYLYGSVPRGTARPGRSDLDLLLVLRAAPTEADRADARMLDAALDKEFAQVAGVGTLVFGRQRLLSEAETYDMGWFVACLCTPLLGEDLAEYLPRYRPTSLLARETNGDLAARLPRWREQCAAARTDDERRALQRRLARHLVRTAFTLVMPRWNGWTSDLQEMAAVFGEYHGDTEWAGRVREAAGAAHEPTGEAAALSTYTEELGPWLAGEYARVHGIKGAEGVTWGGSER